MSFYSRARAMVAAVTRRNALDQAMHDEFELHIDLAADDLARRGVPREEAVRQARLAFGNVATTKETARSVSGMSWLDTLGQDVRFTLRSLHKHIGFTSVAVLSLGFGIGAATTMFSVIDALDLRALPYRDAQRLVTLQEVAPANDRMCPGCGGNTSLPTAADWLSRARSYDALLVTEGASFTWEHDEIEEMPSANAVTPGVLDFFGVRPVVGRDIQPTDTLPGAERVAILTYDFWEARFNRDPRVVGTRLRARVGGIASPLRGVTIVGVAPKEFQVMPERKLWLALSFNTKSSRTRRYTTVVGRLKPGVSMASGSAELRALSATLAGASPKEFDGWSAQIAPLRERLAWGAGKGRGVMFGVSLTVLLIAALNVAGLLFNRGAARQQEFAMRTALGASRMRLFRQLLVEGSCLGVIGGLIGIGLAYGGVRIAAYWFSLRSSGLEIGVDHRMLTFAAVTSLVVGVAAAIAPAVRTSRADSPGTLRSRTMRGRASYTSSALITAQIALAFVLVTGAALLSRDFLQLRYLDLGYEPSGLFTTTLSGPREQWSNPQSWRAVAIEARSRVVAIPGIESASLEYENGARPAFVRSDDAPVSVSADDGQARVKAVHADFFKTSKNSVMMGRGFNPSDGASAPLVAIVNKACATAFWPGNNPIGRRVFLGDSATVGEWVTVIGVAEDIERGDFASRHSPVVYRPFDQARIYHAAFHLSVRTTPGRSAALAAAQSIIRQTTGRTTEPFESDEAQLGAKYFARRFNAVVLDVFAAFGLLLAAMGIYGSIAFAVTQRTREIGIRMALGAARGSVLALIARRGIAIAIVGASIGAAGSFAMTRVFASFVSATSPTNPWVVAGSVAVVLAVGVCATLLPARRATAVNPVLAMRAE